MSELTQYRYEAVVKLEVNPVRYAWSKEHFIAQVIEEYGNDNFHVERGDFVSINTEHPNEESELRKTNNA